MEFDLDVEWFCAAVELDSDTATNFGDSHTVDCGQRSWSCLSRHCSITSVCCILFLPIVCTQGNVVVAYVEYPTNIATIPEQADPRKIGLATWIRRRSSSSARLSLPPTEAIFLSYFDKTAQG